MRKIREVLRLHFECDCRHREIAAACCMSPSTVGDYLGRAEQAGVTWEQAKLLSDADHPLQPKTSASETTICQGIQEPS